MSKIRNFTEFLGEKKSPYKKATLLKYKRKWEDGEDIPVMMANTLKAQGLIPRENGETVVSDEYKDTKTKLKDALAPKTPEKKKAIKESFEETMYEAEVTAVYTDKSGKHIEIREVEGTGMVGESMTFAYIFHDGKLTTNEHIKPFMKHADFKDMTDYIKDIYDNNEASAMSFVR
jgi:hypothetical protein